MAGDIGASLGAEGWSLSAQGSGGRLTVVMEEGGFRVEGAAGDLSLVMLSGSVGATLTVNGYTVTEIAGGGLNPQATLVDVNASANEIQSGAASGAAVTGITWSHNVPGSPFYELVDDAGGRFVIESATGQIQRSASGTLSSSHDVTVKVSSDESGANGFATATVTIAVTDAIPPVITSNGGGATAEITVTEGDTAITTVVADGQDIVYSVSGTDADDVSINASTGVLVFASAPDFASPSDANADNDYVFTVTASDGVRSDTQDWTVTVTEAAAAPVNTVAPALSGEVGINATASCSTGTWDGSYAYTYQWQVSDDGATGWSSISGATSSSYVVAESYVGKYLRCVVTADATTAANSDVSPVVPGLGSELWPVTDFSSTAGLIIQSAWSVNTGAGTATANGVDTNSIRVDGVIEANKHYRSTITIDSASTGKIYYAWDGGGADYTQINYLDGPGTYSTDWQADASPNGDDYLYSSASNAVVSFYSTQELLRTAI